MTRTVSRLPHVSARGYTLLELLIVVAVLLLVLSLSWPSLRQLAERRELVTAARVVRGELLRARLDAIEAGRVRAFCFQPGGGGYACGPVSAADAAAAPAGDQALLVLAPEAGAAGGEDLLGDASREGDSRLPPGIRFVDPDVPLDQLAAEASGEASAAEAGGSSLLFYPNGRTFNARLRLASRRFWIDLTVRGITGSVAIGPVQRIETEAEPLPEVIVP